MRCDLYVCTCAGFIGCVCVCVLCVCLRRGLLFPCSALHAAAQRGPLKLMQLLLAHKAEVGLPDAKGWTPLHLAARAGAAPKVQCLLDAGAQVATVNSQGNTPLHLVSCSSTAGRVWAHGVQAGAKGLEEQGVCEAGVQ